MKISMRLGTHLGVLQTTNMRVMAMQARVIRTSRFRITLDEWLELACCNRFVKTVFIRVFKHLKCFKKVLKHLKTFLKSLKAFSDDETEDPVCFLLTTCWLFDRRRF
jgi:hypothetical protein